MCHRHLQSRLGQNFKVLSATYVTLLYYKYFLIYSFIVQYLLAMHASTKQVVRFTVFSTAIAVCTVQ